MNNSKRWAEICSPLSLSKRKDCIAVVKENGIKHRGATTNGRPSKIASEEAKESQIG